MHSYLLDTNIVLFAVAAPERLSDSARSALILGPNVISVVTYWEVMLKSMKGTLQVGDPNIWWADVLDQLVALPLLLRPEHIAGIHTLPLIHKDPFDRVLAAQAIVEEMTLVTSDAELTHYTSAGLSIIT